MSFFFLLPTVLVFFFFSFSLVNKYFQRKIAMLFLAVLIINPFIWFLIIGQNKVLFFLSFVSFWLFLFLRLGVKNKFFKAFFLGAGMIVGLAFFGQGKFSFLKIFPFLSDPEVINAINSARGDQLLFSPKIAARLLFNKTYYFSFWLSQFLKQYSLSNLFSLTEDVNDKIFSTTPFLLIFAPFFTYGLFKSFTKLKRKKTLTLVLLMLLGGVAGSFSLIMRDYSLFSFSYPFIAIFIALGIGWLIKSRKSAYFLIFLVFLNMVITYYKIFLDYGFYGFGQ